MAKKQKKARMDLVGNDIGFIEIGTSANNIITYYYKKNTQHFFNYIDFLNSIKFELISLLTTRELPIKFNLKLESTYNIPHIENSSENRAFKTTAKAVFADSELDTIIDDKFSTLLTEQDAYAGKGSGFSLESIDGLLLAVYRYTPMGGSSYIPLPSDISDKKAIINPQNNDNKCFKWAILAKYVTGDNKHRIGENYFKNENKYNFSSLSYPTPINNIKIFEKNNPNVSVNVYGLKHQQQKNIKYLVFPLKVVEKEKNDHFDLLIINNNEKMHYTYIFNISRLVRAQKTLHEEHVFFCKVCFMTFDEQKKNKLSGQAALNQHKLICGSHSPILPVMPEKGTMLKFENWCKTERHPIVIYADFEALLIKHVQRKGENTDIFQLHHPMSFGINVITSQDVSLELLNQFNIPQSPIIFRGSEEMDEVVKYFIETIVEIARNTEKLLKTNITLIMSDEEKLKHEVTKICHLCKFSFSNKNCKVIDHNHLTGRYRQTICNSCNLKIKMPNFIPVFIHNLSNYDAHFIIRELGYDENKITIIPNSSEKFISFSKYISKNFTIRFIDTFRFMPSSLSILASNLITENFNKFPETAKVFSSDNLELVTRKGVYPYEYTNSWNKLLENKLPTKEDFYSSLKEAHISDADYEHAKKIWDHFKCKTLGEYSDLYLKVDVLLLVDVFENFRNLCIATYNIDPAYYYTAPGLSFDAMLKYTNKKIELLTDYDMLLMFEKGIIILFYIYIILIIIKF